MWTRYKGVVIGFCVLLGLAGLIAIFVWSENKPSLSVETVSDGEWTHGGKDAKVIFIEYSDFQCPACKFYYPILKQLEEEFGNEILVVYRHFPIRSKHKQADLAAQAAEAAGEQEKFLEMHDKLFEGQDDWAGNNDAESIFLGYARELGLDEQKFQNDLESKEVKQKVEESYQSGVRAKVQGTPTFFLNGKEIQNPRNYETFRNVIREALQSSS